MCILARICLAERGIPTLSASPGQSRLISARGIRIVTSMTTLVAYSEASSEEEETTSEQKDLNARLLSTKKKLKLEIAPLIVSKETTLAVPRLIDPTQKVLYYNPKVEEFSGVDVGPHNPYKTRQEGAIRNILTGYVEDAAFSEFAFEEQRRTFEQLGYAADPAMALEAVGDTEKAKSLKNATIYDSTLKIKHDRPREDYGDVSDVNNFRGVWRKYTDEQIIAAPTKEEQELLDSWKEKATSSFGVKGKPKDFTEKSVLHLKETHDYQGRTFMETPKGCLFIIIILFCTTRKLF
ncbi:pre-mRNA-processing factor 17-like [Zophobas morio]|uniref:pre-mRNA-processing factor 17-like n=1 Tax=Zophobas morio TaxID=2755281 RepID=UPI0030837E09